MAEAPALDLSFTCRAEFILPNRRRISAIAKRIGGMTNPQESGFAQQSCPQGEAQGCAE
jgi:hypothetical protein